MKFNWYVSEKSGGHLVPLLCIAKKNKIDSDLKSIFITSNRDFDKIIINQEKDLIDIHKSLYIKGVPLWPTQIILFFVSIFKIFYFAFKFKPENIYTTGGFISIPVALIGKIFKAKIHIYHLDSIPGKAGQLIHRFSDFSYICFKSAEKHLSKKKSTIFTQTPIRFIEKDIIDKNTAKENLKIEKNKFVILVLGGSQGSEEINFSIANLFNGMLNSDKKSYFCIHQVGLKDKDFIETWYKKRDIKAIVFDYRYDLSKFYCSADIIISRAGGVTLNELLFFKKKSIIIPLKNSAQNHQVKNLQEICGESDIFLPIYFNDINSINKIVNSTIRNECEEFEKKIRAQKNLEKINKEKLQKELQT
jgi:UDP-N-acetylglucosamine--N-acetylmuramyl-(pentapeptide) pyrophosphoryl-undecaprenol N-acetylglucosamine transferase